jgi:hypothetical protein
MPKFASAVTLDRILEKLTQQWHEHHDALAKIQAVFTKYGIKSSTQPAALLAVPTAEPTVSPPAKKGRKRRRLAVSGTEFVLGLLSGGKVLTTAEISDEWGKANRPGKADQSLATMVKGGKLKRRPIKHGRGSTYTLA